MKTTIIFMMLSLISCYKDDTTRNSFQAISARDIYELLQQDKYEEAKDLLVAELGKPTQGKSTNERCMLLFYYIELCYATGDIQNLNDNFDKCCDECDQIDFGLFAFSGNPRYYRVPKLVTLFAYEWTATDIVRRRDHMLWEYLYMNLGNPVELRRLLKVVNSEYVQETTQGFKRGNYDWCELQFHLGNDDEILRHCAKSEQAHARFLSLLVKIKRGAIGESEMEECARNILRAKKGLALHFMLDIECLYRIIGDKAAEEKYRKWNSQREQWFNKDRIQRQAYETALSGHPMPDFAILP